MKYLRYPNCLLVGLVSLLTQLAGCGGGDGRPSVTMLYELTMHDEANAYRAFRARMDERGTEPLSLECGVYAKVDQPLEEWDPIYIDGYSPRVLFVELAAADLDRVSDMGWLRVADAEYRSKYSPSRPCGTLPSMPDGPNVTYVRVLTPSNENSDVWATRDLMSQRSVFPVSVSCSWQSPRDGQPWLMYVELTSSDARQLGDGPWLTTVDDAWRASHPPADDCDWMPYWE